MCSLWALDGVRLLALLTMQASRMTVCVSCLNDTTWLRAEHRANVRREDRGQPPQLTEIRRVKQKMADCAARGHHDAQAGPAARHGARTS